MVIANNTKWICSHLFECGKVNFDPRARGNFYHLIFIAELWFLNLLKWVWNWQFELTAYQFEYDALAYWAILNTFQSSM